MKKVAPKVILCAILMTQQKLVAQIQTNQWGPIMHGARLSLLELKLNQQQETNCYLRIRVQNVSTNGVSVVITGDPLANFAFVVHSPSGRDISPKAHAYSPGSWRSSTLVRPDSIYEFPRIPILAVCPLREQGHYTLIAKLSVGLPSGSGTNRWQEIVSNPLRVLVTSPATNSLTNSNAVQGF